MLIGSTIILGILQKLTKCPFFHVKKTPRIGDETRTQSFNRKMRAGK